MTKCVQFRLDQVDSRICKYGNVRFSEDGRNFVIISSDHAKSHLQDPEFKAEKTTVWGVDTYGKWYKKLTFVRNDNLNPEVISDNGRYMVAKDIHLHDLSILAREQDDKWVDKSSCNFTKKYKNFRILDNMSFSPDSAQLLITTRRAGCSVWSLGVDGKCSEVEAFSNKTEVFNAFFGADSSHIVTDLFTDGIKIWSKNEGGGWTDETIMVGDSGRPIGISPDRRHIAFDCSKGIHICSQKASGEWTTPVVTGTVDYTLRPDTANFSDDSRHVVFGYNDLSISVWSLGVNNEWKEKVRVDIPESPSNQR
ncbi:MAG: hypothetical protein QS748_12345 [Candidatus Endonucleobacter bathymodioli]|uniref:Uncharacterized protein n=1 Tax=Candidatus Endonucleibacter bathymodioli TaxID=539814 RepID=A0AA90SU29_9GAMM|nr:hypothetical protein [Candidatus Endonucleobacter bathymodioli]